MGEVWRVFAAVELTPAIRSQIAATAELLAARGWNARWVKPDKAHMTVRFYGDIDTEQLPRLREELRSAIAAVPGFGALVSGAGAFPSPKRPRVIWLGIDDPGSQLDPLKSAVERASVHAGLDEEPGPYRPHLTVGRLHPQFRISGAESVAALEHAAGFEPIPLHVRDVVLFRSQLGRGGSTYTVIDRFPLGVASGDTESGNNLESRRNGGAA